MPVPTPELGLLQAVDADDTADYLVTNLANSLVSVDALFNNASGHTHGGVHQGGPISSIPASAIPPGSITSALIADGTIQSADIAVGGVTSANIAPPIDIAGMFRTTGQTGYAPASGAGMELFYNGSSGFIQGYDHYSSLYLPVEIIASKITLSIEASPSFVLDSSGNVEMSGALTVSGNTTLGAGGGAYVYLVDTAHFLQATGATITYSVPSGGTHNFEQAGGGYATVQTGNLTIATGNQLTIGTGILAQWNAGELAVTSSPGNLWVKGSIGVGASYGTTTWSQDGSARMVCNQDVSAPQFLITGSNFAFLNQGRSASEMGINVHAFVAGSLYATLDVSGASITNRSSEKIKQDLRSLDDDASLARVLDPRVAPQSYSLIPPSVDEEYLATLRDARTKIPETMVGFTAEQMALVVPEVVTTDDEGDPEGIQYGSLVAILWGAVRALNARLAAVEAAA